MTLVEVMGASVILTMVLVGVLQGMLQSRRMTEGSVRQASIGSLVQGYIEQIKSIKYADVGNALPSSPTATPGAGTLVDWQGGSPQVNPNYTISVYDATQTLIPICLMVGPAPLTKPVISTLPAYPTDPSCHHEDVDIDNINSLADNSTLDMWVWVNDLTGTNVVKCKSIVVVYQWSVKDGAKIKYYSDMMRTVRSIVPTD